MRNQLHSSQRTTFATHFPQLLCGALCVHVDSVDSAGIPSTHHDTETQTTTLGETHGNADVSARLNPKPQGDARVTVSARRPVKVIRV